MYESKKRPSTKKAEKLPPPNPPRTEIEEEKLACGLAMDLAIKWMREGTAPAQVVVHFLKIQSQKEQVEIERLKNETELVKTKRRSIEIADEAAKRVEVAMKAFASYSGKDGEWEVIPDDYPDNMDYSPNYEE